MHIALVSLYSDSQSHTWDIFMWDTAYVTRSDKTRNKGHLWLFQLLISSEPLQTKL